MLHELLFFNELAILKTSKLFREYARTYRIERVDSKDPSVQLEISEPSIKDLFKDLLYEIKATKYQITLKVLLSKYKKNTDKEFPTVYFNSTTKTVFGSEYDPGKSFQEIFNRIDNWISEGFGWIIESIHLEYVNISICSPLSQSSYIELPVKFKNSKGLITTKNNATKCFLWCHIRHLNLLKTDPERITKADRKMVNNLDYAGTEIPVSKKDYSKIEQKIIFALMYFVMKMMWFILFMYQLKNLRNVWIYCG